jgi:ubiquinone/menaquinone biosynthesis C-methylase UbiE
MDTYFKYMGFDIPVDLLNMTGGGIESFEGISKGHIDYLKKQVGINPSSNILEIGCGIGRDAIPLTQIINSDGSYLGIDIIGRSIAWCSDNISTQFPNFKFAHFDVEDQLHNPEGTKKQINIPVPLDNNSVDLIILWSVVTHLFEEDILHYFQEFARVLKPNGIVVVTCFVVDEKILESAKKVNLTQHNLRFEHSYGDGCFINDINVPAGAVAYTFEKISDIVSKAGLKLDRPLLTGQWWGNNNGEGYGQDVLILRRYVV